MTSTFETSKKTHKTIEKTLALNLKNKYGIEDKEILKSFLKIHGIDEENFEHISTVKTFFNQKLNDVSIDDNSNKNEKTMKGILNEAVAPIEKVIGYDFLYQKMKDLYGKSEAKRLSGEMYDFSLAISDSTKLLLPYCWALDASKIVFFGRPFGQLQSMPPKRLGSYIAAVTETVHQMSNHVAGALAIGSFFLDVAHILIYKEEIGLNALKNDKALRKSIENEFQQFVHGVNHLSRIGNESPFTNLSIFDKVKIKNLLSKENYYWYFEGLYNENDELNKDYENYVIDFIMELQKIYLQFFDKGDPSKNGIPYRFPVTTINLSKKQNDTLESDEFLNYITKLDISRYNIFISEGNKVSSCCRLINNADMLELAGQVNSFGGGSSISLGSHRVITTNFNRIALEANSLEDFYKILDKRVEDSAKILNAHKKLIEFTVEKGLQMFIRLGWIDLNRMFSTYGIIGGYEASLTLKDKFGNIENDSLKNILEFFNKKVGEYSTKYGIIGNVEQIPAESMAVRLCNSDKLLFKDKVVYEMYSNQFVPLWENASLWKRMELDGKYNKLLTGGGVVHFTIGEKVTSKQAKVIIKNAISCGCEHFALNAVYSECVDNHVNLGKYTLCPNCNKEIKEYYTRVVGFFVPISSWNKTRREWEFPKRVILSNGDLDKEKV